MIHVYELDGVLASTRGRAALAQDPRTLREYHIKGLEAGLAESRTGVIDFKYKTFEKLETWIWCDRPSSMFAQTLNWIHRNLDDNFPAHRLWVSPNKYMEPASLRQYWLDLVKPSVLDIIVSYHAPSQYLLDTSKHWPWSYRTRRVLHSDNRPSYGYRV